MTFRDAVSKWWHLHEGHVLTLFLVFPPVWLSSPDLQQMLPPKVVSTMAPIVAALGLYLRMRDQAADQATKPNPPPSGDPADNQR